MRPTTAVRIKGHLLLVALVSGMQKVRCPLCKAPYSIGEAKQDFQVTFVPKGYVPSMMLRAPARRRGVTQCVCSDCFVDVAKQRGELCGVCLAQVQEIVKVPGKREVAFCHRHGEQYIRGLQQQGGKGKVRIREVVQKIPGGKLRVSRRKPRVIALNKGV